MRLGASRTVSFTLGPERVHAAGEWLTGTLWDLDERVDAETWTDLSRPTPEQLASAELLFIGDGKLVRLLEHVREHG